MRVPARLAASLVAAAVAIPLLPAGASATPVCTDIPREACGGRVFPEPMASASALTYAETMAGLEALAEEFPGWVTLETIGESFDGEDLFVVEVTDPEGAIPIGDRKVVLVSQSIHGNEPGGREGGVRFLEDLLREETPAADLLDRVRLVQVFLNPDGWRAGDHDDVSPDDPDHIGLWVRGNGNGFGTSDLGGVDLNRQFPWRGWIPNGREPLSEPESRALVDEVARRRVAGEDLAVSTDIHGEVTDTAAWIMLSSGQFDLRGMTKQRLEGEATVAAVDAALSDEQLVLLAEEYGFADDAAFLTASSEFGSPGVGGSGSGFLGDWLAQPEGAGTESISTVELFALEPSGPGLSSLTFRREIFQIYRDTVAAILGELMVHAATEVEVSVALPGRVGYVVDPTTTTDPITGETRSPMDLFAHLAPYVDAGELVGVAPEEVGAGGLDGLEVVVVTSELLADDGEAGAALREFAHTGGTLVLTDGGNALLGGIVDGLGFPVLMREQDDLGQFDRTDPEHRLFAGTRENGYLLLEPATLGYAVNRDDLPLFTFERGAYEAAGGTTVATADSDGVLLGELTVGDGTVVSIGTLLPQPQVHPSIRYGLNSYGVLDVGYDVLLNALGAEVSTQRVDAYTGEVLGEPDGSGGEGAPGGVGDDVQAAAADGAGPRSLPSTGGGVVMVALAGLLGAAGLGRIGRR